MPDYIKTDYCLTIQHDGFISCPDIWTDKFLEYDYIGAPWPEHYNYANRVGNGGFCLKSKKFLLTCKDLFKNYQFSINRSSEDVSENEDFLTSVINYDKMLQKEIKFAPVEIAALFSTEHPTKEMNSRSFGFHDKFTNFSKSSYIKKYELENQ